MESFVDIIKKLEKDSAALEAIRTRQRAYNKVYYSREENKEKIKIRHDCPCGLSYVGNNKKNHERGRIHQLWIKFNSKIDS